jgi:hypothetical protein
MWNIDLRDKCFGGADNYYRKIAGYINAGSLLLNLQYMRKVGFADEAEKILEDRKKLTRSKETFPEEYMLVKYSKLYKDRVLINLHEFNTIVPGIPYQFLGPSYTKINNKTGISPQDYPAITIMHYCWLKNKPWALVQDYEDLGCPDYRDLEHQLWKKKWMSFRQTPCNPWSFTQWYKYYQLFREVKVLIELD